MAIDRTHLDVVGLVTVLQKLKRRNFRYTRQKISNIMRSETKGLRKEMKALAPKDGGDLKKSISSVTKVTWDSITTKVGPRLKKAHHAHWVELGTKAHHIKVRPHPGTDAQPYVRPVYEANKTRLPRVIMAALKRIYEI